MSAKKLTPAVVEKARALAAEGYTVREIAEALGVGKSQLAAALAPERNTRPASRAAPKSRKDTPPDVDPDADPLTAARALLARNAWDMARLAPDSPRRNQTSAEARALVKLIEALERTRAAAETPEEAERRRRREDAETRKEIEQYVSRAERDAEERGVCLWCKQPLPSKGEA